MSEIPIRDLIEISERPRGVARVDALRVLLIDDDPASVAALRTRLEDHDITIVGSTDSVERALDLARTLDPHVAVIRWSPSRPIAKVGSPAADAMTQPQRDVGAVLGGGTHG